MKYNYSGLARKVFILMVLVMLIFPGQVITAESSGNLREASSISDSLSTESEGHLNFSLRSDDSLIENPKHDGKSFQLAHSNYRYINHTNGNDKEEIGYQSGDEIVKLVEIVELSDSFNDTNHYTFQQNHVFVKDLSENNQLSNYEYGDDVYNVGLVNESASIERKSGNYRTAKESLKYINSSNSEGYSGTMPIVQSSDSILGKGNQIKKEGSGDVTVNLSASDYQVWEDPDFGTDYTIDDEGGYGEPIYDSGGDGNVDAGVDKRITKATIFTGDDQNQSTIDLDLIENTLVNEGDEDVGSNLNDLSTKPTINEIDPDGSENSSVGVFGEEDTIVIDVQGNSKFDSNRDIALNGDVPNGTTYDVEGIKGTWKNGLNDKGKNLVIFDKNNNNKSDDLLIRGGEVSVGEAFKYYDKNGKIRYFNTNSETSVYTKAEDGLFVDIKENGVSGDPYFDLRLSNYKIGYPENTTVKDRDLDAELSMNDFESNEFFVDLNMNDELENGEPLLNSKDASMGPEDDVILDGGSNSLSTMSVEPDSFILLKTAENFQKDVPIVRVESNYPEVSKQYTTNNLSFAENISLNGFSNGTEDITIHHSNSPTFTDNSGISIIERVDLFEASNVAKDTQVPIEVFSKDLGHISLNSTIQSTSGIYREKDTQSVGSDTFGDRLTAVTVRTNGTLSETHIKSVSLEANNTTLATASDPTPNGSWVLEPDADTAWFGPGDAGTEFSLQASVTADAPGGETIALEVPPVSDANGDGAYDPGDTGLFLEQDAPRGGLGPGATLTVEQSTKKSVQSDSPTPVALSVETPETNVSATAEVIPVTVRGNHSDRALEAALEYADNETVAQSRSGELDAAGTAEFAFEAVPGEYQIRVGAVETNDSARSEPITVEPPAGIRFVNQTSAVQRGEPAPFEIDLEHTDSARIRLEDSDGSVLGNVSLAAGNQAPPYEIQVLTSGRDTVNSGPGYHLETNDTPTRTTQWISAIEQDRRVGPSTDPGAPPSNDSTSTQSSEPPATTAKEPDMRPPNGSEDSPANGSTVGAPNGTGPSKGVSTYPEPVGGGALAAGEYTLIVTGADNQRATAVFQVGADWSATVETLVAPRNITLTDPTAVQTHASRQDEVAVGDRVVVAVNTTGLGRFTRNISVGGPPPHAEPSKNATQTNSAKPAAENGPTEKSPPAFVSVGTNPGAPSGVQTPPGLKRIETANPDHFYVVAEAGGESVRPGTALETAVVLTEETPFVPRDDDNLTAEMSGQAAMNVIEARAALGGVSENGSLDLPAQDTVPINGTTTVAPGTTATVHIDGANDSFTTNMDVTVEEDGTYETTADLSDYESGTEYTVSVTADGDQLSPLRSGQFLDTRSGTHAAGGGGGGGGGRWQSGSSETGAESVQTETAASSTTTDPADSPPEPGKELPKQVIQRAWSAIPEPLRIGPTQLLLIALGSLALLAVGLGIRRLVRQ